MNETAAATSSSSTSSAAAVADSASAAATTKTAAATNSVAASVAVAGTAAAAAANSTTTPKATSVKLLIKASNQQYDDQILEIDLLWTVKRLKAHLAIVYPNKPPVDEQKLIYSGQLLNDSLLLKDVIRSYKDVYTQNHIIHLVYTPKNSLNFMQKSKGSSASSNTTANMSPNGNTNDGLRQRNVANAAGTTNATTPQLNYQQHYYQQYQQQQPNFAYSQFSNQHLQCPVYDPNNPQYSLPFGFSGQINMQAMASQQAAMYNWMQQVYSQYMEQCMRMANTTATATGMPNLCTPNATSAATAAANMPMPGVSPFGFNPFLQQMPFLAPATAAAAGATNPVIPAATLLSQSARPAAQTLAQPGANAQAAVGEQAQQPAQQERQQQAAAPRFPNIVQEEQENRDWLDSFFSITRLAIFLTILYFNSSPLRCLAVVLIAGGIYLYHIGVLRLRNERNNNNINRNNNAADVDQIRRGVQQVQQAAQANELRNPENRAGGAAAGAAADADDTIDGRQAAANAVAGEGAAAAEATENNNDNTASVISVVRTFVVTFFTSLLPETPTL